MGLGWTSSHRVADDPALGGELMEPLYLCCDRCRKKQPTARSYTTAGVCCTLCEPCREELDRPATSDHPRDPRDVTLAWLF